MIKSKIIAIRSARFLGSSEVSGGAVCILVYSATIRIFPITYCTWGNLNLYRVTMVVGD